MATSVYQPPAPVLRPVAESRAVAAPVALPRRALAPVALPMPAVTSATAARTRAYAFAALALALTWGFGLGSVLAIVFGGLAIARIRDADGWAISGGMAAAGLLLGVIGVLFSVALVTPMSVLGVA